MRVKINTETVLNQIETKKDLDTTKIAKSTYKLILIFHRLVQKIL